MASMTRSVEELQGKFYCYPIKCGECGKTLAGVDDKSAIGQQNVFPMGKAGDPLCKEHTQLIVFVATGIYSFGGGTPCDFNKSFRTEDVVRVR